MSTMPTWEDCLVPTLKVLTDGEAVQRRKIVELASQELALTDAQRAETLDSGRLRYLDRIEWAISYLFRAGALARPQRAHYQITNLGLAVLAQYPNSVSWEQLVELAEDMGGIPNAQGGDAADAGSIRDDPALDDSNVTPTEQIEAGMARLEKATAQELLSRLLDQPPAFFEHAVVKLLLAMGYGGSEGTGVATPLRGDGGIDGVIDQDILGLSRVYIQAKRYAPENVVARPDIQAFVGALSGKADRGVYITTSRFSSGAREYANSQPFRIVLIDGDQLTKLMIRYNVGVQVKDTYHVVEIDEDFFE